MAGLRSITARWVADLLMGAIDEREVARCRKEPRKIRAGLVDAMAAPASVVREL
jgi:hypothetical protein